MKKAFYILSLCVAISACGNNKSAGDSDADSVRATDEVAESRNTEVDTSVNNIGTDRTPEKPADEKETKEDKAQAGSEKGKQLLAQSDCLTCHKEHEKLVGPAYVEVAKKYEANDKNLDYLADKIIKGGQGVWGQVPMTPHPSLSKDDAREMARYILSIK